MTINSMILSSGNGISDLTALLANEYVMNVRGYDLMSVRKSVATAVFIDRGLRVCFSHHCLL